jgi:hypothetical protein
MELCSGGLPYADEVEFGCILGTVEIIDCVQQSTSPWFVGKYGYVLRNPIAFKTPIPMKGKLGFWNAEIE